MGSQKFVFGTTEEELSAHLPEAHRLLIFRADCNGTMLDGLVWGICVNTDVQRIGVVCEH